MNDRIHYFINILYGLLIFAYLIGKTISTPVEGGLLLAWPLFLLLVIFTMTFGVPLGGGVVSLLPMNVVAAYLVIGGLPAAWVVFIGSLIHGFIRYHWSEQIDQPVEAGHLAQISLALANASVHSLCILIAGAIYQTSGGMTPLITFRLDDLHPLAVLGLVYISVNFVLAALYFSIFSRHRLKKYMKSLSRLVILEAYPMVFAPLIALIYNRLGIAAFTLLAVAIVLASLIAHNLATARQRLERRVRELDSLQAVGQALSASLNLENILWAIYTQVAALMPADNFYVALYDSQTDEVTFPLVIEGGRSVHRRSRQIGEGLKEYALHTKQPLLIRGDINAAWIGLGLPPSKKPVVSYLSVPILAGGEPLGVIALQSYSRQAGYDNSHKEILATIAAQAAIAIQNARLYARTDEILARRVQELDSILRASNEGILLLDPGYRVLAANRAAAKFLSLSQADLANSVLDSPHCEDTTSVIRLIGYTIEELHKDLQDLIGGVSDEKKQKILIPGPPEKYVERTLTPVRDREGAISGYLIVLRDISEERELEQLREEMAHMLIHDLRSPISTLQASLNVMEESVAQGKMGTVKQLLKLAQRSGEKTLNLIGTLLSISQLEGGEMPLKPVELAIEPALREAANQLAPMLEQAMIRMEVDLEPDLPPIRVDPDHFNRALYNLLDNAYKFTPDGGKIRLWARTEAGSIPPAVRIAVSDTGPGISLEDQVRLFKRFQQVTSTKGRRAGTGLGLLYCRLAVEAHGGKIWVESEPGKGSTFVILLPVRS